MYLLLIFLYFGDGGDHDRRVDGKQRVHREDAHLVSEYCPAEVHERVERDEAANAGRDEYASDDHQRPHAALHGAKVSLRGGVESLQTSDGLPHFDETGARVQHVQDNDEDGE